MTFKEREKVRVKTNLKVGKEYNGYIFQNDMTKYAGKTLTILSAEDTIYGEKYKVAETEYIFTEYMLEPERTTDVNKLYSVLKTKKEQTLYKIFGTCDVDSIFWNNSMKEIIRKSDEYNMANIVNKLKYDIAINCKTNKEAEELFEILNKLNYTWWNKTKLENNYWNIHKENTCYVFGKDKTIYCLPNLPEFMSKVIVKDYKYLFEV